MNNIKFILNLMLLPMVVMVATSCSDDEAITYSVTDLSSRVTGTNVADIGAGADLTINGTQLDKVLRVFVDDYVATPDDFVEQTATSLTFKVPELTPVGETSVMVIFPESGRATIPINVIPLQVVNVIIPNAAEAGEVVRLIGQRFNLVTDVVIGGVPVTPTLIEDELISFVMPSDAVTGPILLSGSAGASSSADDLAACSNDASHALCGPVINANGSFEEGDLGVSAAVPGWGFGSAFATYEVTDEEYYRGSQSVKITVNEISPDAWRIQPNTNVPVDPTKTYHLSFWVKGTGFTGGIKFAIDGGGSPGYSEYGGSDQVVVISNEWTEIAYDFSPAGEGDTGGDNTARFAPSLSYEGNLGGVIYFDNLRVTEVE